MSQLFWSVGTCTVTVARTGAGGVVFSGYDGQAFGTPGHAYSYDVVVPGGALPALRRALGVDEEADVLSALVARVDEVMPGGEAAWLTANGVAHDVSAWSDPPD